MESCPKELLNEIKNYTLETYYNNKLAVRSVFFKKLSNSEIMSYNSVLSIIINKYQ
jgi:hypothetical protein